MVNEAKRIVGFSGAGISTESGIPDFRSPNGIWAKNRTVMFQEFMASYDDRVEYWRQKVAIWPEMKKAIPNDGHHFFVKIDKEGKLLGLITQNIDNMHQKSGLRENKIVELHGTLKNVVCLSCGVKISMDEALKRVEAGELAPQCLICGGFLKPATVSFGQSLSENDLTYAFNLCSECDLFIAVGSSLVVQPAAGFPVLAKNNGAKLVIINRTETCLDSIADLVIHDGIGKTLQALLS